MIRVDPYRTPIYTADEIDEMLSHIEPSGDTYTKSEIDAMVSDIYDDIDDKQGVLTAGDNVSIVNDVISATDTKYTAGTGISIDANNVISASGGSGGSWTLRDNTITSWLDLFQLDNVSNIVAKKDIIILLKSPIKFLAYIPKNFTGNKIRFTDNVNILNGNKLRIVNTYEIEGTDIGGQNIGLSATSFTIDFDNKTLTSSSGTMSRVAQKTDFIIYTKD